MVSQIAAQFTVWRASPYLQRWGQRYTLEDFLNQLFAQAAGCWRVS